MKKYYIAFGILTAVVIATIVYGFSVAGTPRQRRAAQFDQTRMSNLNSISYSIENYYISNDKLPTDLTDVKLSTYNSQDPETGDPYDYEKVNDTSYKLCATFKTDSADAKNSDPFYDDYYATTAKTHKKGYDCITYELPKYVIDSNKPSFNPSAAPFASVITISSPTLSSDFKQGTDNVITWTNTPLANIDITLVDSNNKHIGYISTIERAKNETTTYTIKWKAQSVYKTFTGEESTPVAPGKYRIKISTAQSELFTISK